MRETEDKKLRLRRRFAILYLSLLGENKEYPAFNHKRQQIFKIGKIKYRKRVEI